MIEPQWPRCYYCVGNQKADLKETGHEGVDWIEVDADNVLIVGPREKLNEHMDSRSDA